MPGSLSQCLVLAKVILRTGSILGCLSLQFSAGQGGSSVDAWYSTSIDIEEVVSKARQRDFHIFVADLLTQ